MTMNASTRSSHKNHPLARSIARGKSALRMCAIAVLGVALLAGCAARPTRLDFQADRYQINVHIDPEAHRLVGRTTIDLVRIDDQAIEEGQPVSLELALHPALKITRVTAGGVEIVRRFSEGGDPSPFETLTHVLVLDQPVERMTVTVEYRGKLFQDVSAGEKAGEIHNFEMRAHISSEGVYLGECPWYPKPIASDDAPPRLAEFIVKANHPPGITLVAGAERDDSASSDETSPYTWHSPYPLDGMVLVGGPHEVHQAMHGDTEIRVYLRPEQSAHADGLIAAAQRYLERYEPLIGPYPAREFKIVDNFFSSGFAFPTFTLLSSDVIHMGERSQTTHGYIDHEVLHGWWGNGVFVDPRDGNWCEALASYGANYYGYVLDGDEARARKTRRNYSHFLSRLKPEEDKPLGTYGRPDGCGRAIAYDKGAAVFHMLARKIGQDTFWAAMRQLTAEYVGRHASWEDIRRVCEAQSEQDLSEFFDQWVRGGSAPMLNLIGARYSSAEQKLTVALSQGESNFDLEVPIRLYYPGSTEDVMIRLNKSETMATLTVDAAPERVVLDPDYHIFRKVRPDDIIPTTGSTRDGHAFASILPAGEPSSQYTQLKTIFEGSFDEEGDDRLAFTAGDVDASQLTNHCLLILGDAVHDSQVRAFLGEMSFPVHFAADGFEFDGVTYSKPGQSVLATFGHPGVEGGGVTVLFANSREAIPAAYLIPFYADSLVIFEDGHPTVRSDFERFNEVIVEH